MRLRADEGCMYDVIDQRDLYRKVSIGQGVFLVCFLIAFAIGFRGWITVMLMAIAALELFLCWKQWKKYDGRIMKLDECYIELTDQEVVCRQPKEGIAESCRIKFEDITAIQAAADSKIYIKFSGNRSFVLEENSKVEREVFQLRSFGYQVSELQEFCQALCKKDLPVKGMELVERWKEKKQKAMGKMILLGACYVIPYIVMNTLAYMP